MSLVLPYEQLIAAKLEQLPPLPALADEIWLRIEKELDEDPPTGDEGDDSDPSGPVPGSGSGQGWSGWSFLIFLGAASLLLFRETGNFKWNDFTISEPVQTYRLIGPATAPSPISPQTDLTNSVKAQPSPDVAQKQDSSRVAIKIDSLTKSGAIVNQTGIKANDKPVTNQDSSNVLLPATVPVPVREKKPDTLSSGRKKPTGIPIGQDEYKVVPKRDSAGGP